MQFLEILKSHEFLIVPILAVLVFLLLKMNPKGLQNKNFEKDGNSCPNGLYHGLIVLVVGAVVFFGLHFYKCERNVGSSFVETSM